MSETDTTASVQETVEYIEEQGYIEDHKWASSGRLILSYPEEGMRSHAGNAHVRDMRRKLGYKLHDVNFRDRKTEWVPIY